MITATYLGQGEYQYPRVGVFTNGKTYEITPAEARSLAQWPKLFQLTFSPDALEHPPQRVGFLGNIDINTGYGGGSVSILRALTAAGIEADVDTGLGLKLPELPPDARAHLALRPWFASHQLIHSTPEYFDRATGKVRIGWTMWETSALPTGLPLKTGGTAPFGNWAALTNTFIEHLIVPSKHSKSVFESCGVTVPISVVPYGLDTDVWQYVSRKRPEGRDLYHVGVLGDLTNRKSPFEIVEAFQIAFPLEKYPHHRLHLKTYRGTFGLGKFGVPKFSDPRIAVYDEHWPRTKVLSFLQSMHCFIWLSKGEGFGLPPVQAALTGCPVVTTYNTGQAEWFDKRYFYGVDTLCLEDAPVNGTWECPNVEQAADQLLAVYNDYEKAVKRMQLASGQLRKKFSLEAFGAKIRNVLEGL